MGHDIDQQQVRLDERRERVASRKHKTALLIQQSLSYTQDRQAAFTLLQEHGFRDAAQELVAHVVALQALSKAYLVPFLAKVDTHVEQDSSIATAASPIKQLEEQAAAAVAAATAAQPAGAAGSVQDTQLCPAAGGSSDRQGNSGSSSLGSNSRGPSKPPPPPPPLPGRAVLATGNRATATAATAGVHKQPPRAPPPAPPLPAGPLRVGVQHKKGSPSAAAKSAAAVNAAFAAAVSGASEGQQGQQLQPQPGAPKPPPPAPPPPPLSQTTFARPGGSSGSHGSNSNSGSNGTSGAGVPGPRPPPPPRPLPQRALHHCHSAPSFTAGSGSSSSSGSGARVGAPPPPPPPLPPGGLGRGTAAPRAPPPPPLPPPGFTFGRAGAMRQLGSTDSGEASSPTAAAADDSSSSFSTPRGINVFAAAAAAAARNAQQQLGLASLSDPCTPRAAQLLARSNSLLASPRNSGSATAAGGGGSGSKLKRLHVDPVPRHRLADGSFWQQTVALSEPFQGQVEFVLRSMFSNTASGRRWQDGEAGAGGECDDSTGARVIQVVPVKRAMQVEVCIKRLRLSATELAAAINGIDTLKLKPDDLPQIRSIMPKPDELATVREAKAKAVKEYETRLASFAAAAGTAADSGSGSGSGSGSKSGLQRSNSAGSSSCCSGSGSAGGRAGAGLGGAITPQPSLPPQPPRLGVVEAAFEALGGVKMLMAKMRACEFKYDIESVSAQVDAFVRDLGTSLDALRTCGQLQYLLAFVRDVANTMNASSGQGAGAGGGGCRQAVCEGFKLESLSRLQSTRMAGATELNLLHYIVAHMLQVLPGVLQLDAEREAFKAVMKRGTFDTILARVRGLQEMHKRISTDLAKAQDMQQQEVLAARQAQPPQQQLQQQQQQEGTAPPSCSSGSEGGSGDKAAQEGEAAGPVAGAAAAGAGAAGAAAATAAGRSGSGSKQCSSSASSASASAGADPAGAGEQAIYIQRLQELLTSSAVALQAMQDKLAEAITQFKWTAEFYSEDVSASWKQQPGAFIAHFLELLEALDSTRKDTARVARVTAILHQYSQLRTADEAAAEAAAVEAALRQQDELAAAAGAQLLLGHMEHHHHQLQQREHVMMEREHEEEPDAEAEFDGEDRTGSWVAGLVRAIDFELAGGGNGLVGLAEVAGAVGSDEGPDYNAAAAAIAAVGEQEEEEVEGDEAAQAPRRHVVVPPLPLAFAAGGVSVTQPPQQQEQPQQQPVLLPHQHLTDHWGSSLSLLSGSLDDSSCGPGSRGSHAQDEHVASPSGLAVAGIVAALRAPPVDAAAYPGRATADCQLASLESDGPFAAHTAELAG